MNIDIPVILCTAAVSCTHAGPLNLPIRYIPPIEMGASCYLRGEFYQECPPNRENIMWPGLEKIRI